MTPRISAVVPVYNEAGNILPLVTTLAEVLGGLGQTFEVILVNDGSTDDTATEIAAATAVVPSCRELRLSRRGGQADALLAGLRLARGQLIVTLDGDGQNDPRDIPPLFELVAGGACDLACGRRVDRHEGWVRCSMSRLANRARRYLLRDRVHDAGCQLRVFRREVTAALEPMELMQSFVPALAVAAGFRVEERPVRDHPRRFGRSKYSAGRLWWRPAVAMFALRWRLWRRGSTHRNSRSVPPPNPARP